MLKGHERSLGGESDGQPRREAGPLLDRSRVTQKRPRDSPGTKSEVTGHETESLIIREGVIFFFTSCT